MNLHMGDRTPFCKNRQDDASSYIFQPNKKDSGKFDGREFLLWGSSLLLYSLKKTEFH